MELIQIIYSILIYGGISLFLAVFISFMISKAKNHNLPHTNLPATTLEPKYLNNVQSNYYNSPINGKANQKLNQLEQTNLRKLSQVQPQIFQIERTTQREIKIVRKPTFYTNAESSKDQIGDAQRGSSRYTIVNEQINNSKTRVMNFYL